jgi:hypothetical protein
VFVPQSTPQQRNTRYNTEPGFIWGGEELDRAQFVIKITIHARLNIQVNVFDGAVTLNRESG